MNIFIIFFSKILVDLQISSVDYGVFFILLLFQFRMTLSKFASKVVLWNVYRKNGIIETLQLSRRRTLFPRSAFASLHFFMRRPKLYKKLKEIVLSLQSGINVSLLSVVE